MKYRINAVLVIVVLGLCAACDLPLFNNNTEYTVKFESNGGSAVSSQTITEGGKAARPADPEKQGFSFDNWYADADMNIVYNFNNPVKKDVTLYAKWLSLYTVIFDSNEGSNVRNQIVTEGKKAARPENPEKTDFIFDDWYTDPELETVYDFNQLINENITLYAKWLNIYTVTFETNGGNEVPNQTIGEGKLASRPQNPAQTGFGFAGWYSDEALTEEYDFNTAITNSITLYAKWGPKTADSPNDTDDFGIGAIINGEFNIYNEIEWNSVINTINSGGNGTVTVFKNYIININDSFSIPGNGSDTWFRYD